MGDGFGVRAKLPQRFRRTDPNWRCQGWEKERKGDPADMRNGLLLGAEDHARKQRIIRNIGKVLF